MANRSGKFYRKNESEVMKSLGLKPTPNSGSGWIVKEDGQNESVICQLKSTDANSIRIVKQDIDRLNYNAIVAHKLPVFAIQFLQTNEVYLLVKPDDLTEVAKYITNPDKYVVKQINSELIDLSSETKPVRTIKSSSTSKKEFLENNDSKFKKQTKSAT